MVIPALDVLDGKCVQLIGGDPANKRIEIDNILEVALKWYKMGANFLHIIDLNAALGRGNNMFKIGSMISTLRVPIQFGGGIRDDMTIMIVMAVGAKRAILGTMAIKDRDWLKRVALTYKKKIIVAVDAKGRNIVVDGWREGTNLDVIEFVKGLEEDDLPLAGLLYTNVDVEGRLAGTDLTPVKELVEATKLPVFASGGISSMDDLRALAEVGVEAAIVGTALYTEDIDLREAIEEFK